MFTISTHFINHNQKNEFKTEMPLSIWAESMFLFNENFVAKGQEISEWIYEAVALPKI